MVEDDDPRPRPIGMNHVALEVGDVEDALAWYGGLFDFELRGRGTDSAFIDMGDQFLALIADGATGQDDHRHIGLVVDDLEATRRQLDAQNIDPLETPGLDIRDPWGNRLQLVEYSAVQFTKTEHVLTGMNLGDLEKFVEAVAELREKGLAPE